MTSRLAPVALASALLLTGCPSTHVNATVTAAPSGSERGGATERLAGASVSMDCPQVFKGDGTSLLGRTDKSGELHFREPGGGRWIHDACDLVVEMPGFQERRFPVASVCKEYNGNHCIHAVISAELVRAGAPAPRGGAD